MKQAGFRGRLGWTALAQYMTPSGLNAAGWFSGWAVARHGMVAGCGLASDVLRVANVPRAQQTIETQRCSEISVLYMRSNARRQVMCDELMQEKEFPMTRAMVALDLTQRVANAWCNTTRGPAESSQQGRPQQQLQQPQWPLKQSSGVCNLDCISFSSAARPLRVQTTMEHCRSAATAR